MLMLLVITMEMMAVVGWKVEIIFVHFDEKLEILWRRWRWG